MGDTERGSDGDVIATYREIAIRFGLGSGPDAGRLKAKRAGWPAEPRNHPADPVRVRVPRTVWEAAAARSIGDQNPVRTVGNSRAADTPAAATVPPPPDFAALIAVQLQPIAAELREVRELAERRAVELAELRERIGRAEAEREQAEQRVAELTTERDHARAERDQVAQRAKEAEVLLDWWTAGGPIARAARALFHRRRAHAPTCRP